MFGSWLYCSKNCHCRTCARSYASSGRTASVAEVPEDRVRLGERSSVVQDESRNAEAGVQLAEELRAVRALDDGDLHRLVLEAELREQEPHLVAVARDCGVVEEHRRSVCDEARWVALHSVKVTAEAARRFLVARQLLAPARSLAGGRTPVLEVFRRLGSIQFDPLAVAGRSSRPRAARTRRRLRPRLVRPPLRASRHLRGVQQGSLLRPGRASSRGSAGG